MNKVVLAADCACLCTEAKAYALGGVDVEVVYVTDPKPESFNFLKDNNVKAKHHFRCMREATSKGKGLCMEHLKPCVVPGRATGIQITDKSAGVSCRGFSTSNMHRLTLGAEQHEDSDLMLFWVQGVKQEEPDEATVEK